VSHHDPCPARVSHPCSIWIDSQTPSGRAYEGTLRQLSPFCPFLGLFAPVHVQDAQISLRRAAPSSAIALGTVPQCHPHATETSSTLRFAQ
jgi:hypothetical protein